MEGDRRNESGAAERVRGALLVDAVGLHRDDWGTLRVTGPDRATWLNGIVTCDVTAVTPENGAWGLLLSKQGKIEAELQIVASPDSLFIAVPSETVEHVGSALDRYLVMEDAEVEVVEDAVWWELHGARAAAAARGAQTEGALAGGSMGWTARGGAALVGPRQNAGALDASLVGAGVLLVGAEAWEAERIRLGLPRFGLDYDAQDNPHAAGLERRAVSWSKGCYLGQEVVCMQDMRGKVKRRIVRLELDDGAAGGVQRDVEVTTETPGEACGRVTSRAGGFALASLRAPATEPGTRVTVGSTQATVRPLELVEGG